MRFSQQSQVTFKVGDSQNDLTHALHDAVHYSAKLTGMQVNDDGSVTLFFNRT